MYICNIGITYIIHTQKKGFFKMPYPTLCLNGGKNDGYVQYQYFCIIHILFFCIDVMSYLTCNFSPCFTMPIQTNIIIYTKNHFLKPPVPYMEKYDKSIKSCVECCWLNWIYGSTGSQIKRVWAPKGAFSCFQEDIPVQLVQFLNDGQMSE